MSEDISTLLEKNKNKIILLKMRDHRSIRGVLLNFDIHINLTLDDAEDISNSESVKLGKILIRGINVIAISVSDE